MAPEQVSGEQRRAAKAINFGLIYGMSAFGLAPPAGHLDAGYGPGIRRPLFRPLPRRAATTWSAPAQPPATEGYVETVFGRRLYLPEIASRNGQRRAQARSGPPSTRPCRARPPTSSSVP